MKVKELITELSKWKDDFEVCLSIDSEVNEIKELKWIYTTEVDANLGSREIILLVPSDKSYQEN